MYDLILAVEELKSIISSFLQDIAKNIDIAQKNESLT
jgi:hypothetical protein